MLPAPSMRNRTSIIGPGGGGLREAVVGGVTRIPPGIKKMIVASVSSLVFPACVCTL